MKWSNRAFPFQDVPPEVPSPDDSPRAKPCVPRGLRPGPPLGHQPLPADVRGQYLSGPCRQRGTMCAPPFHLLYPSTVICFSCREMFGLQSDPSTREQWGKQAGAFWGAYEANFLHAWCLRCTLGITVGVWFLFQWFQVYPITQSHRWDTDLMWMHFPKASSGIPGCLSSRLAAGRHNLRGKASPHVAASTAFLAFWSNIYSEPGWFSGEKIQSTSLGGYCISWAGKCKRSR